MAVNYYQMSLQEILTKSIPNTVMMTCKAKVKALENDLSPNQLARYRNAEKHNYELIRKELFIDKGEYIPSHSIKVNKKILSDENLFKEEQILFDSIKANKILIINEKQKTKNKKKNKSNVDDINIILQEGTDISDDELEKRLKAIWGDYPLPQLKAFSNFYNKMTKDKQGKMSEIVQEGWRRYTKYSVMVDYIEKTEDKVRYEKLASDMTKTYGLNIGGVEENFAKRLFIHPEMIVMVEEGVNIIPLYIEWNHDVLDDVDFFLWNTINYQRQIENKSSCKYMDIYNFKYEQYLSSFKQVSKEFILDKYKERLKCVIDVEKDKSYYEPLLDVMNKEISNNEEDF